MKTTMSIRIAIIAIAFTGLVFACKKDNSNSNSTNSSNVQTGADDQAMVSNENENVANDANAALISTPTTNGDSKTAVAIGGTTAVNSTKQINGVNGTSSINGDIICDAAVAFDTASDPRTITITYNGTNCWGNRTRTGTVVISIPASVHWRDVGAVVNIAIQNLVITRVSDGKTITLNGTKTMTNVNGGSLKDLATIGTITHVVNDSLSVTFADSAVRTWNVSKQRVFTYNNGIVITTTGLHSDGNNTGIAEWGTNRFGVAFESLITQPKVIRQDCDFRLVSGQNQIIRSDNINSTITYGLDASGNPTSCPGSGLYYLEIVWTLPNARTNPIIIPYF